MGKKELVDVLGDCSYVNVLWFHVFTTLPIGAEGGLRSLILAFPGDLFIVHGCSIH